MPERAEPWFSRFADIPGVRWQTPPGIDPARLPGFGARPEASGWEGSTYLYWPSFDPEDADDRDAQTSQTPASQYASNDWREVRSVDDVVRKVAEALELPGSPSDYHFIIAGAAERLWKLRMPEPRALREMERLCRLDMDLVSAWPAILTRWVDEADEDRRPLHMAVCDTLYRLYFNEGFLREAEQVAREAVEKFGQEWFVDRQLKTVRERLAALEAEDA